MLHLVATDACIQSFIDAAIHCTNIDELYPCTAIVPLISTLVGCFYSMQVKDYNLLTLVCIDSPSKYMVIIVMNKVTLNHYCHCYTVICKEWTQYVYSLTWIISKL